MGDKNPEVQAALAWEGVKGIREDLQEIKDSLKSIDARVRNVEASLPDKLHERLRGLELWRSWALGMSAAVGAAFSLAVKVLWDAITGGRN